MGHIRQIKADAERNNATASAKISELEVKIQSNEQAANSRMSGIEAKMAQLEQKNSDLEARLQHVDHFETGRLSTSHKTGTGSRNNDVRQTFKTPYDKTPQVILGTTRLDESSVDGDHVRFEAYVISVDTSGFTVRFNTWSSNVVTSWTVDWISVPAHQV